MECKRQLRCPAFASISGRALKKGDSSKSHPMGKLQFRHSDCITGLGSLNHSLNHSGDYNVFSAGHLKTLIYCERFKWHWHLIGMNKFKRIYNNWIGFVWKNRYMFSWLLCFRRIYPRSHTPNQLLKRLYYLPVNWNAGQGGTHE